MSTAGPDGVGASSSTPTIEAVIRECEALKAALARARTMRLVLLTALAVFVGVTAWTFYGLGQKLKSEENLRQLEALAKQRLVDNNDKYMKEVQLLVDHTSPVVTQAFYTQAKKDLPGYLQAFDKERNQLADGLQQQLLERMDAHYKAAIQKRIGLMEAEYPELKDPEVRERLVNNLAAASRALAKKYYVDEMKVQLTAFYDAWDHFPAADPPGQADPPIGDQFIGALLELLQHNMSPVDHVAQK